MRKTLTTLWRGALDLIVPPSCWICEQSLSGDEPLCAACLDNLTVDNEPVCPRCASSLAPAAQTANICPRCLTEVFAFDRVVRLGPYDDARRAAILRAKYPGGEVFAEAVAPALTGALAKKLTGEKLDVVIPIPLHWRRRWQRGYNQSDILARALAAALNLSVNARGLRRIRYTPKQTTLDSEERRRNVRGVFRTGANCRVQGANVLLVDDVLTTGATADESSKVLKKQGAKRIIVAVVAHERPHSNK
jgi:ComF family protein